MKIDELEIHPLAQAALRYFTVPPAAEASNLAPDEVIDHLGRAMLTLTPAGLQRAGHDLLLVSRFLLQRGNAGQAEWIAKEVSRAANAKIVEQGGSALLAPELRPGADLPPLPAALTSQKQPGLVEEKWASMSDGRKQGLLEMADEIMQRLRKPAAESAPEPD